MHSTGNPAQLLASPWRRALAAGRLALATACVLALISRFQWGLDWVGPGNYFAYLTIQSNIAFAIVTAIAGVALLQNRSGPRLDAVRAGVLICVLTAGIVFAAILQQSAARGLAVYVSGSDVVLHFVLPLVALLDWMATPRTHPPKRVLVFVLGYVAVWGVITLIRGSITGWYPYYFLDPNQTDGVGELLLLSSVAVAVFSVIGLVVLLVPPLVVPSSARGSGARKGPGSVGPPPRGRRHQVRPAR